MIIDPPRRKVEWTLLVQILAFLVGLFVVAETLGAALRTVVLPRGENVLLTQVVFGLVHAVLKVPVARADGYERQDRWLALYGPTALLSLAVAWVVGVGLGYSAMFWALGQRTVAESIYASGSSLLTLGFVAMNGTAEMLLSFSEATIGLGLVALLVAYLPVMYQAFSRRETAVALLEVYAGNPPSAVTIVERVSRIRGLEYLGDLWGEWERWFAEVEESHTSHAILVHFRSPRSDRSWVTAAGTVLDAAALQASTLDVPADPRANLCIRAGYLARRRVADMYGIEYPANPSAGDPISIARDEFDDAYSELRQAGVPLKDDQDQAWRDFAGWRVNYDTVLLALAALTVAPAATWSSDRSTLAARSAEKTAKWRWF